MKSMETTTLDTIVKTVYELCLKNNYNFREHYPKDSLRYWSVIDEKGFRFIHNESELADYMVELLKKEV